MSPHRQNHDYELTTHLLILNALDERGAYSPDKDVALMELHAYLAGRDDAPAFTAPDSFNDERLALHRQHLPTLKRLELVKSKGSGHDWYLLPAGRDLLRALAD